MIPFASQRGLGQDLATHLQNEFENEFMEVAELRGSIAQDLHGAFAEWEVQARTLTKCRNYLYSLSVNPDPAQEPWDRDMYADYIARTEKAQGLTGQPRAVVFHVKDGREHCHVVWSRIDTQAEKAIPLAFDHDKLMMVTRAFAREYGLRLPDGYHKDRGRQKNEQFSLYEQHQQRTTGLTKEERMEQVTNAWRLSDTAVEFVKALARLGYILATGRRSYVLVDIYGHTNALPKMIGDKAVRTRHIRAFLEKDFPPDSLPSVEIAIELATEYRRAAETHGDHEQKAEAIAQLEEQQAVRREQVEQKQKPLRHRHHTERVALARTHRAERDRHRCEYLAQVKAEKAQRRQNRRRGLSALFNKLTGIALIQKALRRYRDRQRHRAWWAERNKLRDRQQRQRMELERRHDMQTLDLQRQSRALDQIDARELQSLEDSLRADRRIAARGEDGLMPPIPTTPMYASLPNRLTQPPKADEHYSLAFTRAVENDGSIDLIDAFERAAGDGKTGDSTAGSSEGPKLTRHAPKPASDRSNHRNKDRER